MIQAGEIDYYRPVKWDDRVSDVHERMSSEYIRRVVDDQLDELFPALPAILLDGPKGVGKTSTALRRASRVRNLDDDGQRSILEADPRLLADDDRPLLIDEWHLVPAVWDVVRRLVDADHRGGQFLLTGSMPTRSTHSGAGRIADIRMRPMCLSERLMPPEAVSFAALVDGSAHVKGRSSWRLVDYTREIVAGGWPAMRGLADAPLVAALDAYLARIVDRDLPDAGHRVRRPAAVTAWLRAYAAATGTSTSWEKIRDAATPNVGDKPAKSTTSAYTELLTALRILDPLEAWEPGFDHLGMMGKAVKHYLADPALAARLLRRSAKQLVTGDDGPFAIPRDGTLLGALFEHLAVLSVRVFAQRIGANVYHLRTGNGTHEVDMVVEGRNGELLAIEVKLSGAVSDGDGRHLRWLSSRLGDDLTDMVILSTGPDAYRRPDGIAVVPLAMLVQ